MFPLRVAFLLVRVFFSGPWTSESIVLGGGGVERCADSQGEALFPWEWPPDIAYGAYRSGKKQVHPMMTLHIFSFHIFIIFLIAPSNSPLNGLGRSISICFSLCSFLFYECVARMDGRNSQFFVGICC